MASRRGMGTIVLLSVDTTQVRNGTCQSTQVEGDWTRGLPRHPGHASGIFTKHSSIDSVRLATLTQRFCKAPRPTRIYNADLHLAVSLQGERQVQTVVAAGFQAHADPRVALQQKHQKGLMSSRTVGKSCDREPVLDAASQ